MEKNILKNFQKREIYLIVKILKYIWLEILSFQKKFLKKKN